MVKLLYKVILIILALFVTKNIIEKSLLPWYWGNYQLASKLKYIEQTQQKPNTYFIGSSNIYRQIQPTEFDNLTVANTKSFNLGNDGCFMEQNLYIIDNLLKNQSNNIQYIFLELNGFDDLAPKRYGSTKSKYFTNFSSYLQRIQYIRASSIEENKQKELLKKYSISYFENFFKIGMRQDMLTYSNSQQFFDVNILGPNKDGYVALPGTQTDNKVEREFIPRGTNELKNKLYHAYKQSANTNYNTYHLKLLEQYIKDLKNAGIHLIFLFLPKEFKLETQTQVLTLFNLLPKEHKIDLANPTKYPSFFASKNKWDPGHFNNSGAKIFSSELAKAFNQLVEN